MNKTIGITLGVLVIIGGLYWALGDSDNAMLKEGDSMQKAGEVMMEKTDDSGVVNKDESMVKADVMVAGDVMMKSGSYEAYSPEKLAKADTGKVVLFFRASWCPSCRALDADIKANAKNIPEKLTILDVDYDKSSELKKKYGVTSQHTIVQVDSKGNMIAKWNSSPTLSSLTSQVK